MIELQQAEDIRKEPLIRKKWAFTRKRYSPFADGILVTGPNSFVGAHMLKLLSDRWQGKIYLLVRAGSEVEASGKMQQAFKTWDLGDFDQKRFDILLGDVGISQMGLKPEKIAELHKQVGFVLHLAMNPLYHLPYAHFQRLWLPELARMINFCGHRDNIKSLHYPGSYNANFFTDDTDFKQLNTNAWQSGYAGFKWVARQVLANAFGQNLNGCHYDIPLVVGSEEKGICPAHYSIWHILDLFLKTGYYIPFAFRIIPVDVLAEVVVKNLLADKAGRGKQFIRPVLKEAVTDIQFSNTVAGILGLRKTDPDSLREACNAKHRFDFMFPGNFYNMIEKVNALSDVWPENFDKDILPTAQTVFLSNLNSILSKKFKESELENNEPVNA